MIGTLVNYTQIMALLSTDTTTYDQATLKNLITLLNTAFTPAVNTAYASLTPATFTGSTPLQQPTGAATTFHDPASGLYGLIVPPPAGGWVWQCTTAPGSPETIFGYVLTNSTTAKTFGSNLLPAPVVISLIGDTIVIPAIAFGVVPGSLQSLYG